MRTDTSTPTRPGPLIASAYAAPRAGSVNTTVAVVLIAEVSDDMHLLSGHQIRGRGRVAGRYQRGRLGTPSPPDESPRGNLAGPKPWTVNARWSLGA